VHRARSFPITRDFGDSGDYGDPPCHPRHRPNPSQPREVHPSGETVWTAPFSPTLVNPTVRQASERFHQLGSRTEGPRVSYGDSAELDSNALE